MRSRQNPSPSPIRLLLLIASLVCAVCEAHEDAGRGPVLPRSADQDESAVLRRREDIGRRLATQAPVAVVKMSDDPAEKFYPEYWIFDDPPEEDVFAHLGKRAGGLSNKQAQLPELARRAFEQDVASANATMAAPHLPALRVHLDQGQSPSYLDLRHFQRDSLHKRGYQCPTGTRSCARINRPNRCCGTGQTCIRIKDTGRGDVGCCPLGSSCAGVVLDCKPGYKQCPDSLNGGCCVPGYKCDQIGCIPKGKSVSTRTLTYSSPAPPVVKTRTTRTVTYHTYPQQSTYYYTTTTPTSTLTRTIGVSVQTVTTITKASMPVRPTLSSSVVVVVSSSATVGYCPSGHYVCSARYQGGCCRVGRDCHSTHCPAPPSSDIIPTGGVVTVVVPVGHGITTVSEGRTGRTKTVSVVSVVSVASAPASSSPAAPAGSRGSCAQNWFSCGAAGGCCPDGYRCAKSCIATHAGVPAKIAKVPSLAAAAADKWSVWVLSGMAGVVGVAMVWL